MTVPGLENKTVTGDPGSVTAARVERNLRVVHRSEQVELGSRSGSSCRSKSERRGSIYDGRTSRMPSSARASSVVIPSPSVASWSRPLGSLKVQCLAVKWSSI